MGRFTLSGTRQWHNIAFSEVFEGTPRLFLTQQTSNDANATSVRARNVDTGGFQAFLQEQESLNDGHGEETIGYLAIYSPNQGGRATLYGASFDYQLSQLTANSGWTTQGDQQLKLQEEASNDSELGHTSENLDILQIEGHLFAQDVGTKGWDTISIRRRGPSSEAVITSRPTEGNVVYLHTDHLGAVVKATDEDRNIVWDAARKPFGGRYVKVEQVEMPLGFPGQYYDEESGNFYNYFRDYDPGTGRYLQSDPIGLAGGLNTYGYVGGNPLGRIDPRGDAFFIPLLLGFGLFAADVALQPDVPFDSGVAQPISTPLDLSGIVAGSKEWIEACRALKSVLKGTDDVGTLVLGKMDDLASPTGWKSGDYLLPLNKNSSWADNQRLLQNAMDNGKPIKLKSPNDNTGFLGRENQYLHQQGWNQTVQDGDTFWVNQ